MRFTRRELLLGAAAIPLLGAKKPPVRPNVILITVDGIGAWMLGAYGNRDIRTPNLDILSQSGTRFVRSFACTPAPAPSRATLLTGRTPSQLGIAEPASPGQPALEPMLSDTLSKQGYACGYAGVWDLGAAEKPRPSFQYWQPAAGTPAETTANALRFLEGQKAGQPFFLAIAHALPAQAGAKYAAMYADSRFETIGWDRQAPNAAAGKEAFQDIIASLRNAAASVTEIDAQIPPVLDKLDERGLRDSTVVVFTGTCGSLLGRHGLWDSGRGSDPVNMYDEVVGVPLIWHWRVKVPPQAVRPEVVSLYDLAPALAELAGAGVPEKAGPGRSYLPAVLNEPFPKKRPWINVAFGEFLNASMVRDKRYKLILRKGGGASNELYDEIEDPRERTNQYGSPKFITIRDEMTREMEAWRAKY